MSNPLLSTDSCVSYMANTFGSRIVGERCSSRSADFASALVFAQEYGILAVSVQDRPFLPKSSVVLNGLPVECVSAFRKWEDRRDERAPRILPLNAVIEAIRQ